MGNLPDLEFFQPLPLFVDWAAARWRDRLIYDVGAGRGHVSRALADAGLDMRALDLYYRQTLAFPVEIADGETEVYHPGSVVMICRPCHGDFTYRVSRRAAVCGAHEVVYVGLERNVESDLGMGLRAFHRVLIRAGKDHESVFVANAGGIHE